MAAIISGDDPDAPLHAIHSAVFERPSGVRLSRRLLALARGPVAPAELEQRLATFRGDSLRLTHDPRVHPAGILDRHGCSAVHLVDDDSGRVAVVGHPVGLQLEQRIRDDALAEQPIQVRGIEPVHDRGQRDRAAPPQPRDEVDHAQDRERIAGFSDDRGGEVGHRQPRGRWSKFAKLRHGREPTIQPVKPLPSLGFLALLWLVAACGGGTIPSIHGPDLPIGATSTPTSAATLTPTGTPVPTVPPTRFNGTVTLADGRSLKARCVGEGTPTILLEVGGSGDMSEWQPQFVSQLAAATTTCLYSRAGGTGSSPLGHPSTMAEVTSDAFELLDFVKAKAGVEGPYVFVGWSLGGSVALGEALTRPNETVGVAILDTDFPLDFLPFCAAQGRTKEDCQAEFDGDIDARLMESEIARAVHPLDIAGILVSAMEYPDCVDTPGATL